MPARHRRLKLATFNVNGIVNRLDNLTDWLQRAGPDVVCLQELKCEHESFPARHLRGLGYDAVWRGEKRWNGVAILSRVGAPVVTRDALPGDRDDGQSRYIEAAVAGMIVACAYMPNGNPQPGPKFAYKLAWMARFNRHARTLLKAGVPAVLAGDFNVVPTPADIYKTTSYDDDALVQPRPRAAFKRLVAQGWTDALRKACPEHPGYTFWSYLRNRWPRDAGLRIDFLLASPTLAPQVRAAGVDRWVRGEPNASDHAPVWLHLQTARGMDPRL